MKTIFFLVLPLLIFILAGCQNNSQVCPPATGSPQHLSGPPEGLSTPLAGNNPGAVKIGWQTLQADKVVQGPLCNDTWSGTVYVGCDVQVYPWKEEPTFLEDCNLNIEPGTIVYVAYHNNAAYYNGCSCHTAPTPVP